MVGQFVSLGAENSDRIGHRQLNDDENLFKKIKRKKKENKLAIPSSVNLGLLTLGECIFQNFNFKS